MWDTRIAAGVKEHDLDYQTFRESLYRSDILLNRKALADLAAWEPYTFKALTDVAKRRAIDDGLASINNEHEVDGIITRGSLRKS